VLAAREDETEFAQIPHNYNRNITKGLYDREIVAHITHFLFAGKFLICWTDHDLICNLLYQ